MDMNNAEKCAAKMTTPASPSLLQNVALRQFIKFCIVGAGSVLMNQALIAGNAVNEKGWAPLIAFVMAAFIVVFWNFFANKLWTFNTES